MRHHRFEHRLVRRRVLTPCWLAVALLLGCGSGTPAADTAPQSKVDREPIEGSAEAQCLDAANRPRERVAHEPAVVGLRHILIRHAESRRKDPKITRTRGLACMRALDALHALEGGADWDSTVAEYSDEKGAATRKGSLGTVRRDDLEPAFADAAFGLEIDQLSYVVESPAGFHIILRVE